MERLQTNKTDHQNAASFHPGQPRASERPSPHPLHQLRGALGNRAFGRFIQAQANQSGDEAAYAADTLSEHLIQTLGPQVPYDAGQTEIGSQVGPDRSGPPSVPAELPSSNEMSGATTDSVVKTTFKGVIARRNPHLIEPAGSKTVSSPTFGSRDPDAEEGLETADYIDPAAVTAAFTLPLSAIPNAAEGETVSLPDISMPETLQIADADAIASAITYSSTITQVGVVSPFGETTWNNFNITGTTVTPVAGVGGAPGSFNVAFTLENPITFNVASPKTDISSENDPDLTNANFATAASDLTPNMAVQGGKPPRTQFWARDLTIIHERFHCNERSRFATAGAAQAQTWLNAQTAADVAGVQALIAQVPGRVITASRAAAGTVDQKETRAYGDGAASYLARATAISTRGALGPPPAGGYP